MENETIFDAIIIGGSYAGLSSAMALGRSIRKVLVIDGGTPCNRPTPYSHNFLSRDGQTPTEISEISRAQVAKYPTVSFLEDLALTVTKTENHFEVVVQSGRAYNSKKIVLATGLKDHFPEIEGFKDCWGISIIHCPYCHGYEYRGKTTGILYQKHMPFHYLQMISNWTNDLTVFTNGQDLLTPDEYSILENHNIQINTSIFQSIEHNSGNIKKINFENNQSFELDALYAPVPTTINGQLHEQLGCEINDMEHLATDHFQETNVKGVYACGDIAAHRSLPLAVQTGSVAGIAINNALIEEKFAKTIDS